MRLLPALLSVLAVAGACSASGETGTPVPTSSTVVTVPASQTAVKPAECYLTPADLKDRQRRAGAKGLDALNAELDRQIEALSHC